MPLYEIDPLSDSRWPEFVRENPRASIFHTRGWLEAVYRTYGHRPAVITTSGPGRDLANGIVFCRVRSWVTGRRLVSAPFSDHCDPLCETTEELNQLLSGLETRKVRESCRYAEIRPSSVLPELQADWESDQRFYLHRLDLRAGTDAVFRRFHRDCIQRRIRHAVKQGVTIKEGRSPEFLSAFYKILVATRQRHGLPPQPMSWFRNIMKYVGESALVRVAYIENRAIAAILTLQHGKCLCYKYGVSLAPFHKLAAMPYLIYDAIRGAIERGLEEFDFGRTDCDNAGLTTFKERWNAAPLLISYVRLSAHPSRSNPGRFWLRELAESACKHMPKGCLTALGTLSYRHTA